MCPTKINVREEEKSSTPDRASPTDEMIKPLGTRDAFERDYLVQVLALTEGNVSQAAKLAGKYRADFYDLLKKHQLKVDEFKKAETHLYDLMPTELFNLSNFAANRISSHCMGHIKVQLPVCVLMCLTTPNWFCIRIV